MRGDKPLFEFDKLCEVLLPGVLPFFPPHEAQLLQPGDPLRGEGATDLLATQIANPVAQVHVLPPAKEQ